MSNVLIGIVGVILFIGLALAGALFLGPRFQEATLNSKASATIQNVSQVARAAQMYRLQEGVAIAAGSPQELLDKRYLKTIPTNPIKPEFEIDLRTEAANYAGAATVVGMGFDNTPSNIKICSAIERQSGQQMNADGTPKTLDAYPADQSGCFLVGPSLATAANVPQGLVVVYSRI